MSTTRYRVFAAMIAGFAVTSSLLQAQSVAKYKGGDAIQVFFLNKWFDATVIETNRTQVLAEFEFANRPKRQAFNADQVRYEFEQDAIGRARTWSDMSGKFRVRAALIGIDEDKITLRKEDMKELSVPISKLSTGDQAFLKRLQKELGPAAQRPPSPPPVESFDVGQAASLIGAGNTQQAAVNADPVPAYQKLAEGGVAFPIEDFHDRMGAVLPLGGKGSYLLAAIESQNPSQPLPTRLLWGSTESQKVLGRQLLPAGEIVLDYHGASHRLLTFTALKAEGDPWGKPTLTVWEVLPGDKNVTAIVRWDADSDAAPHDPWGRLADANTIVHRWKKQEYVGWDLASKSIKYKIAQESFFAPLPTLSGGRRQLFVPEDKQVRVFDAVTGRVLSVLPAADGAASVAITEDGRRAAVLGRTSLTVWELTTAGSDPEVYQAEAIGTPFRAEMSWVGDRRVMVDQGHRGQVLFSLDLKLPLWNYQFDHSAVRESGDRRLRDIVDGHLVYAASLTSGRERGLAVGAVKLPGPKVEEAAANLDRESLNVMKPGSAVALDVRCGQHDAAVRAALAKQIADNQWELRANAPAVLTAEMGRGESQTVTYQLFGAGGGQQSATITPFFSKLKLEIDGKPAWQSGTSTGAPPVIRLEEGQTAQGQVDQWQNPNPGFFASVDLPAEILDPAKRSGLGTTNVTTQGLVPK